MKLDHHIADLLYRYDCVIVPDFGGFVANYQPAKINSRTNTFSPPAKQLSFNRNLKSNDGLLASHIIDKYKVSYEEALSSISNCVYEYKRELQSGKRILIDNVGVLYLDENTNILFEPLSKVNFLTDAFGLEKFHASPVKEESKIIKLDTPERKGIHPARVAAAIAIPLFFVGASIIFQQKGTVNYSKIQLSNLGYSKVEANYKERNSTFNFQEEMDDKEVDILIENAKDRSFIPVAVPAPAIENWFVVGGCFSEEENAEAFVNKLKAEGYPAKQIKQFKKLHAVAYQAFEKEGEARAFLADLKRKDTSAWLLKKK